MIVNSVHHLVQLNRLVVQRQEQFAAKSLYIEHGFRNPAAAVAIAQELVKNALFASSNACESQLQQICEPV